MKGLRNNHDLPRSPNLHLFIICIIKNQTIKYWMWVECGWWLVVLTLSENSLIGFIPKKKSNYT